MKVPFVDLQLQHQPLQKEIHEAIDRVIESGAYILGPVVKAFEEQVQEDLNVKHAIGVASGSDALFLSLQAMGIGEGDEVITTAFTFFATAGSISRVGATPVFADIEEASYNIDPKDIKKKITDKTKAIIVVHLFGQVANMKAIQALAKKHDLRVIEDACQAYGAVYEGNMAGTIGDTGTISFFPTKNVGAMGDAGMVITNDDKLAETMRKGRIHGSYKKYHHEFIGINSRMDAMQAAILSVKLPHVRSWNKQRIEHAKQYHKLIDASFHAPQVPEDGSHIFHQLALRSKNREAVLDTLKEQGIAAGIYYPLPLHLQKCFAFLGYKEGDLPITEQIAKEIFSIPIFAELTKNQISYISTVLNEQVE